MKDHVNHTNTPYRQSAPDNHMALQLREKTRNANSWHAIQTPEEFFGDRRRLFKMAKAIASGFCRKAKFLDLDEMQGAALYKLVECRRTWQVERGLPFGGYAIESVKMWLVGEMYRYRVPVSGAAGSRAEVESVRVDYLDAPMGGDQEGGTRATVGDTVDLSEATGYDTTPEGDADRRDTMAMIQRVAKGLPSTVVDLAVAYLDGQTVIQDECPDGWTPMGVAKVALDLRNSLRKELGATAYNHVDGGVQDDTEDTPAAGWWEG